MISNYDLTEMCQFFISMWTALVLVTKTVVHVKVLMLPGFCLDEIPPSKSELIQQNEANYCSKQKRGDRQ